MGWAKVAVVLGVLLLLAGFAVGTEVRPVVRLDGVPATCAPTIGSDLLVPGTPNGSSVDPRVAEACRSQEAPIHWGFGILLVVGAGALLVGWTALREGGASYARVGPRHA